MLGAGLEDCGKAFIDVTSMGVVAVSGQAASGKTTVARKLASKLNYRFVSIGELFRKIAVERNVSLVELHRIAESDFSIDKAVDEESIREARKAML